MAGSDVYSREELCALIYLESLRVVSTLGGEDPLYLILYILHNMAGADVYSREELCAFLYLESLRVVSLLGGDGSPPVSVQLHITRQG